MLFSLFLGIILQATGAETPGSFVQIRIQDLRNKTEAEVREMVEHHATGAGGVGTTRNPGQNNRADEFYRVAGDLAALSAHL